jgi:hypothetical protein
MTDATILLAGLPESGKTTYLAALFHLLRMRAPNKAGLALDHLPAARDYLMEVEAAWLRFEPLTRTATPVPGSAAIPAKRGGDSIVLSIPDIHGEDFEHLWEYGTTTDNLRRVIASSTGVMLFIRADDVRPADFLDESVREVPGASFRLEDWKPEVAPTQTKLCDILEQLRALAQKKPVAVAVSAWDTVRSGELPAKWLQRTLPLLWQLLDTSGTPFEVFGISAQGGDLGNPEELEVLTKLTDTIARIADPSVRRGDDLTAPLAWLLSEGA